MSLEPTRTLRREDKERLLGQRGLVVWLYGLSGAGKSTLSHALEHRLHDDGILTALLDGDQVRAGLCQDLGFSLADRQENIRRVSEVSRLLASTGMVVICSLITPTQAMRSHVRNVIGKEDLLEVYLKCSLAECKRRDVKGLYAKAHEGQVRQFTGLDSVFEEPISDESLVIDTESQTPNDSFAQLYHAVGERLAVK